MNEINIKYLNELDRLILNYAKNVCRYTNKFTFNDNLDIDKLLNATKEEKIEFCDHIPFGVYKKIFLEIRKQFFKEFIECLFMKFSCTDLIYYNGEDIPEADSWYKEHLENVFQIYETHRIPEKTSTVKILSFLNTKSYRLFEDIPYMQEFSYINCRLILATSDIDSATILPDRELVYFFKERTLL